MDAQDYKFVRINRVSIAYTDRGSGQPILFVHGFASFSYTWMKMISFLPQQFRFVTIDLKGYGYSEKKCDAFLAPYDQAVILSAFIRRMDLRDVILVGHSMGGVISLISLISEKVRSRISRLILLDSAGVFQKLPDFIDDLTATSANNPLIRLADEDLMAALVLEEAFHDENKISRETVKEYGNVLRQPKAKECLILSAKQIEIANEKKFLHLIGKINIPVLIIWGKDDRIISVDDAFLFQKDLFDAQLHIIPDCGHSPQEEMPQETARIIAEYLGTPLEIKPETVISEPPHTLESKPESGKSVPSPGLVEQADRYFGKLRMRRLIDHWSFGTFLLIIFIKMLQLLKKIGFSAEENGWRKATGVFLRNEHSKFILSTFRVTYAAGRTPPQNKAEAVAIVIERLADYLSRNPDCHWALDWGFFVTTRKKLLFTDIIEAEFGKDGVLRKLIMHLDRKCSKFSIIDDNIMTAALTKMVEIYQSLEGVSDSKRAWVVYKKMRSWIRTGKDLSRTGRQELRHFIERALNGTFIQFETLPGNENADLFIRSRLATPNLKTRRHPGFGLLNIVCRFTSDFAEADFWFQYHHVPVDGMPMQEMLQQLKDEWGSAGQIKYPALNSNAAKPEIFYFGHRIFRARIYADFKKVVKLRKHLNERYYAEMGGPASISSMIIWGLAQSEYFRDRKFLFPVDTALMEDIPPDQRNISLMVIRPNKYRSEKNSLHGFLQYQREFNQRMFATRLGKSESYELLELYAMIHPMFYYIARYFMPDAMGEILGTAGVTILKDSEMFVSPLTDLQINGFIALGNLMMPTEDGKNAGAVSICGSRALVREYIKAIYNMTEHYPEFLHIEL
ncbi:MAG: alpha/beta fold hydrolase [Lentisphaerota bacterium]